jgi:hypothetical protein
VVSSSFAPVSPSLIGNGRRGDEDGDIDGDEDDDIDGDDEDDDDDIEFEILLVPSENVEPLSECPICFEEGVCLEKKVVLNCGHGACSSCFQSYMGSNPPLYRCAMCRANIKSVMVFCDDVKNNLLGCLPKNNKNHSNGWVHWIDSDHNNELVHLIDSVVFDMNLFA